MNLIDGLQTVLVQWADDMREQMKDNFRTLPRTSSGGRTFNGMADSAGSGNTEQTIAILPELDINADGSGSFKFIIQVPDYYKFTDKGRKPSRMGMKSNPSLKDSILKSGWIQSRNVPLNGMTLEGLAYVIARSIHRNGYGGSGWFSKVWGDVEPTYDSYAIQELERRLDAFFGEKYDITLDLGE